MSKKDKYLEKIHTLFIECGVGGLKMEEIADKIGITKMTLYNNFSDKETLLREILSYRGRLYYSFFGGLKKEKLNAVEMLIKVLKFQEENPMPNSAIFYKSFKDFYPDRYNPHQQQLKSMMAMFIKMNIEQGRREAIYRDDFNSEEIITYIMGTMDAVFGSWVGGQGVELNLNFTHKQFINYHIRGVANEKGLKILEDILLSQKKEI